MKSWNLKTPGLLLVTVAGAAIVASCPILSRAQPWFYPPPPLPQPSNPMAQRGAMQNVQSQMGWFQNSLRTASSYQAGSYGNVYQQFQSLRASYTSFRGSLNSNQISRGGNDLAQLDAGLDILQEAFSNYQQEVANGESSGQAFNDMCQVLSQASAVWLQEFNQVCNRLRVGWR